MFRTHWRYLILIGVSFMYLLSAVPLWAVEIPLESITPVDKQDMLVIASDTRVLGQTVQQAYAFPSRARKYEYLLNKKYTYFLAHLAFDDHTRSIAASSFSLSLDGQPVVLPKVAGTQDPVPIQVDVRNKARITFYINDISNWSYFRIINPRFTTSGVPKVGANPVQMSIQGHPAAFVVDPNDLDKLATNLRKRVGAKPEVEQKLMRGFIAVMTFDLVDIPSASVSKNVAEDLSTSLINNDFQLVERGQLDQALKELKIQDSALIDQATALQLGQITGCNYIIVGSVSDRGQFLVINTRLLETATGKAVAAERVECRKSEIKRE